MKRDVTLIVLALFMTGTSLWANGNEENGNYENENQKETEQSEDRINKSEVENGSIVAKLEMIIIDEIKAGSPADIATLLPGDILISINNEVATNKELVETIIRRAAYKPVTVNVLRSGKEVITKFTPEKKLFSKYYVGWELDINEDNENHNED